MNRDAFLHRVREAVAKGNEAGKRYEIPPRGRLGYQGAGADPVDQFQQALESAGGIFHRVADVPAALQLTQQILREHQVRSVAVSADPLLERVEMARILSETGFAVWSEPGHQERVKDDLFAADAGVTGVDAAIAETGSLVAISGRERARSVNLLPPLHITLVDASQLLPDLFDWFEQADRSMPACATLITGPSKTGDIELRLVTGVHGPGKVHVVFLDRSM